MKIIDYINSCKRTPEEIEAIVTKYEENNYDESIRGFYWDDFGTACDNNDANCWVNDFGTEIEQLGWLYGLCDGDGNLYKESFDWIDGLIRHIINSEEEFAYAILKDIGVPKELYEDEFQDVDEVPVASPYFDHNGNMIMQYEYASKDKV